MTEPYSPIHELDLPEAYVTACLIHGEWERALDLIAEFGPLPAYAPPLAGIAARLLVEQNLDAALRVASRAVALDPACAQAHSVVGSVLLKQGPESAPAAEASLRCAADLDPQELPACLALVTLYLDQDRPLDAIPYVKDAVSVAPWDEGARGALKRVRKAVEAALKAGKQKGEPARQSIPEPEPLATAAAQLSRLAAAAHQRCATARPPSVSLCLITLNEARNLPRVIGSVAGLVTEVIVVDTGSTDDTVKVARRLGARVDHFDWIDDFAAARNHSLKLAIGDWILVLDADDEFARDTAPAVRDWLRHAPEVDVVGLYRSYPYPDREKQTVAVQPRLFRNGRGLRYEGIIHEQLITASGEAAQPDVTLPVTYYHRGIDGAAAIRRRQARNLPMLKRSLEQHPDDVRAMFYLGITHLEREEWSEAATYLRSMIDRTTKEVDMVRKAYSCLGFALFKAGDAVAAEAVLREGLEWYPHYPELWLGLGLVLDGLGRLEEAVAAHEDALRGRFGPSVSWHDWSSREDKPHMALCDLRLCLGDPEAASRHLEAAEQFTGPRAYYAQVRQTLEEARSAKASGASERERCMAQLRSKFCSGDADAGLRLVAVFLESGETERARQFVQEWLGAGGAGLEALLAQGQVLLAAGALAEALASFESACELQPDCAAAWHGTGEVLRGMGRPEEAERALEQALSLDGEDSQADQSLGELYLNEQHWGKAARCFRRRLERSDQRWDAWLGLGRVLLRTGDLPGAIDCYQRAATLSGGSTTVRRALGEARAHLAQLSRGSERATPEEHPPTRDR